MGVWIETPSGAQASAANPSHPTWVCGLKQYMEYRPYEGQRVTPYVGVWIETPRSNFLCIVL